MDKVHSWCTWTTSSTPRDTENQFNTLDQYHTIHWINVFGGSIFKIQIKFTGAMGAFYGKLILYKDPFFTS